MPKRSTPARPRSIDGLNGLLIGGGADVNPARYKEEILKTLRSESRRIARGLGWYFLGSVVAWLIRRLFSLDAEGPRDEARDTLEFGLLAEALKRHMPVLGICRGGQVINVHCGGSLHQDISGFYTERPNLRTVRARKLVNVEPGSTLARIVGRKTLLVNSLHNQSVKTLGAGLRRAAAEPNGVVQAIEHQDHSFLVGVQWHPEFLPLHREHRRIFYHLIEAARVHALGTAEVCPPSRTFGTDGTSPADGSSPPPGP
jgi:putative glutamine amidotransferase